MLELVMVKQLETAEEMENMLELEREIWRGTYEPMHQMLKKDAERTLVIGAYLKDELIGFCYGDQAEEGILYSHLLGIKREYREMGVGELLKLKQKELAGERGHLKCKWMFEPLEARAAHLYFTKLRAYGTAYYENREPEMEASSGISTDRMLAEWDVADDDHLRWDAKIDELQEEAGEIVPWSLNVVGLPVLDMERQFDPGISYLKDAYTIAIPMNLMKIHIESPALAEDWRYKTRAVFQTLFQQGYIIVCLAQTNEHVGHYLFVKRTLFAL
ncbi:MAG: GNAT family N-acetyltransferase [Lysinibacillus sp.]